MTEKMYLVSPNAQKELVDKHCFGDCGKIRCAGIILYDADFSPCLEEVCPYMEKEISLGDCKEIAGEEYDVYVRKLKG